jgi:hypothetical protein
MHQRSFGSAPGLFAMRQPDTKEYLLFGDGVIQYSEITLRLTVESSSFDISGVTLKLARGDARHTVLQLYFRLAFCVVLLPVLALLVIALTTQRVGSIMCWLTVVLLTLNILRNDSLEIVFAYWPTAERYEWKVFFERLFLGYFYWYALVLFESATWRYPDKMYFATLAGAGMAIGLFYADRQVNFPDLFLRANRLPEFGIFANQFLMEGLYTKLLHALIAFTIFRACFRTIASDARRFRMLAAIVGAAVGTLTVSDLLLVHFAVSAANGIRFVLPFAVQNCFSLAMAYCHWPVPAPHEPPGIVEDDVHSGGAYFAEVDQN